MFLGLTGNSKQCQTTKSEIDMSWVQPWVGLDWVTGTVGRDRLGQSIWTRNLDIHPSVHLTAYRDCHGRRVAIPDSVTVLASFCC